MLRTRSGSCTQRRDLTARSHTPRPAPRTTHRVDLTLRSRRVGPNLEALAEGQVVRGTVKRLAAFGVFVELDGAPGVTGARWPRRAGCNGCAAWQGRVCAQLPSACWQARRLRVGRMRWLAPSAHQLLALIRIGRHRTTPRPDCAAAAGLAHVSEVADEYVKDLSSLFNPGQRECQCWAKPAGWCCSGLHGMLRLRLLACRGQGGAAVCTRTWHAAACIASPCPLLALASVPPQAWWRACSRWTAAPGGSAWASSPPTSRA